jgi:hypothetical protein
MRVRVLAPVALAASVAVLGCGTKPTTPPGAAPASSTTAAPPGAPGAPAPKAPATTAKPFKRTPGCVAMYQMQSLRLRILNTTGADRTKNLQDFQASANAVKAAVPDLAAKLDERVALTVKNAQTGSLTPQEKTTSDGIDKELDAWWDTNCFD